MQTCIVRELMKAHSGPVESIVVLILRWLTRIAQTFICKDSRYDCGMCGCCGETSLVEEDRTAFLADRILIRGKELYMMHCTILFA